MLKTKQKRYQEKHNLKNTWVNNDFYEHLKSGRYGGTFKQATANLTTFLNSPLGWKSWEQFTTETKDLLY